VQFGAPFAPTEVRRYSLAREVTMPETTMILTEEERAFLSELLERTLKEARVQEHRTRAPSYRELVLHQERLITSLMEKLGHVPV
jgi:uncharacterized membrane protein YccC